MASISLCIFGSSPCVKPLIVSYRSSYASYGTRSRSGSVSVSKANFYEILSLSSNEVGTEEIKRAYRSLALKYHPDVSHDQDTTKTFILLQTAYKTLVDPVSREEYDCALGHGHVCTSCSFGETDHVEERRWEGQIIELRRRSSFRSEHKEGSWGSRIRYSNRQSEEP